MSGDMYAQAIDQCADRHTQLQIMHRAKGDQLSGEAGYAGVSRLWSQVGQGDPSGAFAGPAMEARTPSAWDPSSVNRYIPPSRTLLGRFVIPNYYAAYSSVSNGVRIHLYSIAEKALTA